jgi:Poly A polymerase regulatory subunit
MGTVDIKRIKFSIYDRDVYNDETIPIISNAQELMSTDLYSPDEPCERCHLTTSYCRGHIGKILFAYPHVYYPYKSGVNKLLRVMCPHCYIPVRESRSPKNPMERASYLALVRCYNGSRCICTGQQKRPKGFAVVRTLQRIYSLMVQCDNEFVLRDLFGLGLESEVLRSYVIVLPARLLSQVPSAMGIYSAYKRLLESRRCKTDPEEMLLRVDAIYRECYTSLRDKAGAIRQLLVPRKMGNSMRAVIVSDPTLCISDVGISDAVAGKMSSELTVTDKNFQRCVDLIHHGHITHVSYDKQRYKLVSNVTHLVIVQRHNRIEVPLGCIIEYTKDNVTQSLRYGSSNTRFVMSLISGVHSLKIDETHTLGSNTRRCSIVYVDVVQRRSLIAIQVPLQRWAVVESSMEDRELLVHRNPVLSAGSMHMHKMRLIRNPSYISMDAEETHEHKIHINDRTGMLALISPGAKVTNAVSSSNHWGEWLYDQSQGNSTYSVRSEVSRQICTAQDVNCCMSINPMATTTYQADFDGDEMNASLLHESHKSISLMRDMLKGAVGPIHDGMYGVYCLVTDRVGLSSICRNYKDLILNSTLDNVLDRGLSKHEADEFLQSDGDMGQFLDDHTSYLPLGQCGMCAIDALVSIRLDPMRRSFLNRVSYNKHVLSYVSSKDILNSIMLEYDTTDEMEAVARLYSDMALYLYSICDYCGISFDRLESKSTDDVLASKCRTQQNTIDTVYKAVGFTSYTDHDTKLISHIVSSFNTGLTREDFDTLCYSARAQVAKKAETTAPEGDNMRLQCNYLSDTQESNLMWKESGRLFHETVTAESTMNLRAKVSAMRGYKYYDTLGDDSEQLAYKSLDEMPRIARESRKRLLHYGQRKLLIAEIDFMTDYSRGRCLVVYAGAAPGTHIPALVKLFPEIEFHLYDKSSFSANIVDKVDRNIMAGIRVYKSYLTAELAHRKYRNESRRVLYISDIRTNSNDEEDGRPTEEDICRDNTLSKDIALAMNPYASMLKFRLPYSPGTTTLFAGDLRLQCWAGIESTEVRLLCMRPYETKDYDHTVHEQRMYHHNNVRVLSIPGERVATHLAVHMREYGIEPHYDMYRETRVIQKLNMREDHVYRIIDETLGRDLSYYMGKETR